MILLVMGVSGSGKTTVAEALAIRTGWPYLEGDSLHPPENVAKMAGGTPLDDADRAPWLAAVAAHIDAWRSAGSSGVVTCSALKRRYREVLAGGRTEVRLVFLTGSHDLLARRMAARRHHFMPPGLLDSQIATLEPPGEDEHPLAVDVGQPVEAIVTEILQRI